jgi:hypothetical protein
VCRLGAAGGLIYSRFATANILLSIVPFLSSLFFGSSCDEALVCNTGFLSTFYSSFRCNDNGDCEQKCSSYWFIELRYLLQGWRCGLCPTKCIASRGELQCDSYGWHVGSKRFSQNLCSWSEGIGITQQDRVSDMFTDVDPISPL